MKHLFATIIFISTTILSLSAQRQTTIQNPILQGFYPDPSIERVGEDYYLVNSTFAYFPGLPIFHSKDLKNWKLIGHAIDRSSQLNFVGQGTSRALFAPAITYHKGIFYIVCTDVDKIGNFVISATNPAGPWSNPVPLPQVNGIDPSLFFEGDKAYLVYNSGAPNDEPLYEGHRTIKQYVFDYKNLQITGEPRILVNGGVDISQKPVWIEGPHIYKKEDYYYLCAAEGGTSVNHSQVIFRSRHPEGPFEAWAENPILTQRDLDPNRPNPVTSTGHADLFIGPDDNWYAVFLAVRPYEDNYYNIGRETFIAPVTWTVDGWPVIVPKGEHVQYSYTFNWREGKKHRDIPYSGDFYFKTRFRKKLDKSFIFLRHEPTGWLQTSRQTGLQLNLLSATITSTDAPAYVARRLQHFNVDIRTVIDFKPQAANEDAGLMLYQSETHFYYLALTMENNKTVLQLRKGDQTQKEGYHIVATREVANQKPLAVQASLQRDKTSFFYSDGIGNELLTIAENEDAKHLSTQRAGGFVGSTVGLYASSNGQPSTNIAKFRLFTYLSDDSSY